MNAHTLKGGALKRLQAIGDSVRRLAAQHGLTTTVRPNGHITINGPLAVHYYPLSKRSTAYVGNTTEGVNFVGVEDAVRMAITPPPMGGAVDRNPQRHSRRRRAAIFRKVVRRGEQPRCVWCKMDINHPDDATLEHIIPLARGGLDNPANLTLACEKCNQARGHQMPELRRA